MPVTSLYGGGLYFPGEAAAQLMAAFGRCTAAAPDELSLSVAFITFPGLDPVPAPLRGRFVAHLRVAHLGRPAEAETLIAPLRAVAVPLLDTVRPRPITEIGAIHADPSRPQPVSSGSSVLPGWDEAAISVLLSHGGCCTTSPPIRRASRPAPGGRSASPASTGCAPSRRPGIPTTGSGSTSTCHQPA